MSPPYYHVTTFLTERILHKHLSCAAQIDLSLFSLIGFKSRQQCVEKYLSTVFTVKESKSFVGLDV